MTARWPVGGIKTFFRYIYGQEAFADLELILACPDMEVSAYLTEHLPNGRIHYDAIPTSTLSFIRAIRGLIKSSKPALIHSHGFSAGALTALARGSTPVPHLMTAHDVFLPSNFSGIKGRIKQKSLEHLFSRLDGVHAVTEDGARNFKEFMPAVPEDRIHSIVHGVDAGRFFHAQPDLELRERLKLPANARLIGFFGRFMAQKGFRTLVDAVLLLRKKGRWPADTYVVTFGWGGFIREDYAYLESLGLSDVFFQHPYVDAPERAIKAMDVIAMPSRWEACGLLAMEVLSAGTPLVGTSCIGLREVLDGSPARVIAPGDAAALAEELLALLQPGAKTPFEDYGQVAVHRFAISRPAQALRALYSNYSAPSDRHSE